MRSKRERRDGMLEVCLEVRVDLYCAVADFNFLLQLVALVHLRWVDLG